MMKQQAQQQQPPENVVSTQYKAKRSAGENVFDWGLYGAIGFGANTVLSIYLTYMIEKRYPNFFPDKGKAFATSMEKLGSKDFAGMADFGEKMLKNVSLLSGGFAVLPFLKWGEDAKKPIVRGIDEAIGATPQMIQMDDGSIVDPLDLKPKQTWVSLLSGRASSIFIGYVPLAAMVKSFPNYHKPLTNGLEPLISKGPKFLPKGRAFSETVSMEIISSGITSASLYAVSKFVAYWQAQHEEGKGGPPQLAGAMKPPGGDHVINIKKPTEKKTAKENPDTPSTKVVSAEEHGAVESKPRSLEYV